jgi:peptidylprolyl isomerase
VPIVGEALLALGRFPPPLELAAIARWTASADPELRWRAAWALYRPRDAAAVPAVIRLTADTSPEVRFWATRGLTIPIAPPARGGAPPPAVPDWSGVDKPRTSAILRRALADPDRRVRTEALRALTSYDDDESFATIITALDSADTWLAVSAAEALGRFSARKDVVVPRLVAAISPTRPLALRITALTPLAALSPDAALEAASALTRETSVVARAAGLGVLRRLGPAGTSKLDELTAADPSLKSLLPQPGGNRPAPQPEPARPESDYRQLVERWIVPDYNGAKKPHAVLDTPRGSIEIELYAGDAALGLEYFIRAVTSGEIVGTEFGRVVPNFVAQQRTITNAPVLRDEVSRLGLTRGNLSWASAGLDTGRPGYTLGNTPQPHNEGDFTALGRVVRGMDVVDRLELGDKITGARMSR